MITYGLGRKFNIIEETKLLILNFCKKISQVLYRKKQVPFIILYLIHQLLRWHAFPTIDCSQVIEKVRNKKYANQARRGLCILYLHVCFSTLSLIILVYPVTFSTSSDSSWHPRLSPKKSEVVVSFLHSHLCPTWTTICRILTDHSRSIGPRS